MDWQPFIYFILLGLLIVAGLLTLFLLDRNEKIKDLKSTVKKLNESFNELDAQAKLIVKTDLDLNKAQEELDKRLKGLDALQKISHLVSTTLDEEEIFRRLNLTSITELGFEKYLVFIKEKTGGLTCRINIGYTVQEVQTILKEINPHEQLLKTLVEKRMLSSITTDHPYNSLLTGLFSVKHFIFASILRQNRLLGLLFAGNHGDAYAFTEGDEELISILADQISQSLENARLFEEVFRSSQALESKVQERTKQLSDALSEVQQISRTKSEFISAVSHELRTPLTSIKGYASILMTGKVGAIPDQVKERLEKINLHSDNLVKLINELLDISRIESGRLEMRLTQVTIKNMIDGVIDLLAPQIKDKNINITIKVAPSVPPVMMDTSQIERVFINLISNAIKFTPEKGTITINADNDQEKITVSIADTGIGIKDEDHAHLFNEFFRVDNAINQNVKGTGLGLALAKKIVEAHQGKITVKSKLHAGTTFTFTIPLKLRATSKE